MSLVVGKTSESTITQFIMKTISKLILLVFISCFSSNLMGQGIRDADKITSDLTFLVANDTGRNGYYDQKAIARTMGQMAEKIKPECVFAVGDIHHFDGVQSTSDPLWKSNYEDIYNHPELMIAWYPVLGNHEYRGNTQAMIDYSNVSRRWRMPARYYTKRFKKHGTTIRFVLLDTAPLISRYHGNADKYPDADKQDMNRQLQWADSVLTAANEDWIIVMGHHPIYAETDKNQKERKDLQKNLDPILRKHKVDAYICGHLHNFQHHRAPGSDMDYIVNSAGALSREVKPVKSTVFCSPETGFSAITASKDSLNVYFIDKDGKIIHTMTRHK